MLAFHKHGLRQDIRNMTVMATTPTPHRRQQQPPYLSKPSSPSPVTCPICRVGFRDDAFLWRHKINSHNFPVPDTMMEPEPVFVFTAVEVEGDKQFYCQICTLQLKNEAALKIHHSKVHKGPGEAEKISSHNFPVPDTMMEPEPLFVFTAVEVEGDKQFYCQICTLQLKNEAALKIHHSKVHKGAGEAEVVADNGTPSSKKLTLLDPQAFRNAYSDYRNVSEVWLCGVEGTTDSTLVSTYSI